MSKPRPVQISVTCFVKMTADIRHLRAQEALISLSRARRQRRLAKYLVPLPFMLLLMLGLGVVASPLSNAFVQDPVASKAREPLAIPAQAASAIRVQNRLPSPAAVTTGPQVPTILYEVSNPICPSGQSDPSVPAMAPATLVTECVTEAEVSHLARVIARTISRPARSPLHPKVVPPAQY